MNNKFSTKEIVKDSWGYVKNNLKLFIPITLLVWITQLILSTIQGLFDDQVLSLVVSLIFWVINTFVTMSFITIYIKFANDGSASLKNALDNKEKLAPYLIGSVYYGLIVFAGLLLLIVPGIIWAIRYQFYGYLILDKGMSPKEALSKSKEITKGLTLKLLLFSIVLLLINTLGVLALIVGLTITVPISMLSMVLVYKKLMGDGMASTPIASESTTNTGPNNNMWATFRQES